MLITMYTIVKRYFVLKHLHHLNASSTWGMAHIVHRAHFGLALFLKAPLVGLDLHVATSYSPLRK